VPAATIDDLDDAIAAAERGFKVWRKTSPAKRDSAVIQRFEGHFGGDLESGRWGRTLWSPSITAMLPRLTQGNHWANLMAHLSIGVRRLGTIMPSLRMTGEANVLRHLTP